MNENGTRSHSVAIRLAEPDLARQIECLLRNDAAIALYRRHGFTIYGVEPRARKHRGTYVDKVLMVLDLRPG